jgi:hypothetical protein
MTTIDSLYRMEDGHVLIEMKLSSVAQLFNSFDPAPFYEKALDDNADTYIVDVVNDFPAKTRFKIVVYLTDDLKDTKEAREIPAAIASHFAYKAMMQRQKFRQRLVYGEFTLIVGLAFLAIATIASLAVDSYSNSFPAAHFIANALIITGWVAMWEPVTTFLFHLWPIVKQRMVYERISRMEVDIRPYPKVQVLAPELQVKAPGKN